MKRVLCLFFCIILILLSSCAVKIETDGEDGLELVDDTGDRIVLFDKPKKVAVLFSSYAEMWKVSGGDISITVGDSIKRGFCDESVILVNDGSGMKIDYETLIASTPDFVIVTVDLSAQMNAKEICKEAGIPCAAFKEESFEDYLRIFKIFCDINENADAYQTYGLDVANEIDKLAQKQYDFSYLFVRVGTSLSSMKVRNAHDHFGCVILDALGGSNIVNDLSATTDNLSVEQILVSNPEYLFVISHGDEDASEEYMISLLQSDGWKDLKAVKNGNIIFLPKDLFNYKPNQKWADSYKIIIDLLEQ